MGNEINIKALGNAYIADWKKKPDDKSSQVGKMTSGHVVRWHNFIENLGGFLQRIRFIFSGIYTNDKIYKQIDRIKLKDITKDNVSALNKLMGGIKSSAEHGNEKAIACWNKLGRREHAEGWIGICSNSQQIKEQAQKQGLNKKTQKAISKIVDSIYYLNNPVVGILDYVLTREEPIDAAIFVAKQLVAFEDPYFTADSFGKFAHERSFADDWDSESSYMEKRRANVTLMCQEPQFITDVKLAVSALRNKSNPEPIRELYRSLVQQVRDADFENTPSYRTKSQSKVPH